MTTERVDISLLERDVPGHYDAVLKSPTHNRTRSTDDSRVTDPTKHKLTLATKVEIGLCTLVYLGRGICITILGPTLLDLRQIVDQSVTQMAWLFISQAAGLVAGIFAAIIVFPRYNLRLLMSIGMLIPAASTALIPALASLEAMCVMLAVQGIGMSVVAIGVWRICLNQGGEKYSCVFLQLVYFGSSIGSVFGPMVARPFLSHLIDTPRVPDVNSTGAMEPQLPVRNGTELIPQISESYTKTNVFYMYLISGLILAIPGVGFIILYAKSGPSQPTSDPGSESLRSVWSNTSARILVALLLVCLMNLLVVGSQDAYGDMLLTYAVLGPLSMSKASGTYLTTVYWAATSFGNLNGIWLAKVCQPFTLLLSGFVITSLTGVGLVVLAASHPLALWILTALFGVMLAIANPAVVSWSNTQLPSNSAVLSVIMLSRTVGILTLPAIATSSFDPIGPNSLMCLMLISNLAMLIFLIICRYLVRR